MGAKAHAKPETPHVKPATIHAMPATAQKVHANAHAMIANFHALSANDHTMPANAHAFPANAHAIPERNRYSFFFSTILVLLMIMTKAKARNTKMIGRLGVTCRHRVSLAHMRCDLENRLFQPHRRTACIRAHSIVH